MGYQEPMDPRLYEAAASGNIPLLQQLVVESWKMIYGVTQLRDTVMHIALRHEHIGFALYLCELQPELLMQCNSKEGTALHCALQAGQWSFFMEAVFVLSSKLQSERGLTEYNCVNSKGESLLYLAAEVGSLEAVNYLLETPLGHNPNGPNRWNALQVAVGQKAYGIARELLARFPKLQQEKDNRGNTPLHHAVSSDDFEMVNLLAEQDAWVAYISNDDGLLPVHVAANLGFHRSFNYLVEKYLNCGLMTTKRGKNVLHLSVEAGAMKTVDSILANPRLKGVLLKEKDEDGNRPLHLATIKRNSRMMHALSTDNEVDKHAMNNDGLTAEDIDLKYKKEQNLQNELQNKQYKEAEAKEKMAMKEKITKGFKDVASSMIVVATLITTVTFAAAFTMPGGYRNNNPNEGMATLVKKAALKAFLISDTISMCTSMTAAFYLTWTGWYGDIYPLTSVIKISVTLLMVAIGSMGIAFATGVYVVIAYECLWISILIIAMTCASTFLMVGLGIKSLCSLSTFSTTRKSNAMRKFP